MTQISQDPTYNFTDLERNRLLLEENVLKLSRSLQHWRTWEAEYEGLKEEILNAGDDPTNARLMQIANGFDGELLNDKEIKLLLEDNRGRQRSGNQAVNLLNRRIDYVQDNVKSVISLLQAAETQVAASYGSSRPEIRDEKELPITEIREELDEEGNIISSSVTTSSDTEPHIVEALRKAGVNGLTDASISGAEKGSAEAAFKERQLEGKSPAPASADEEEVKADPTKDSPVSQHTVNEVHEKGLLTRKKSVTFAEGTKEENSSRKRRQPPRKRDQRGAKALRTWMDAQIDNAELLDEPATKQAPNDDIRESISSNESSDATIQPQPSEANAKIEENISDADSFSASIPQDESAEDAALRQQMIRYNLEDVGAVVAEMDVDEDSDSWSNVDDEKDNLDGSNTEEDEDEDEDEDKFGRTRHRVVDDDYRRQMYDLENKLNINSMRNLGPNASISNVSEVRSPSTKTRDETNIRAQNPSPTKEVRFADKLDILPATTISDTQQPSENSINRANPNLAHSENAPPKTLPPISAASSPTSSILQPSRFKKALQNQFPQQQQNPPAKANAEASHPKPPSGVHSPIVIERPYHPLTLPFSSSSSSSSLNDHLQPPAEPDALDPLLLQQQVSAEYHRKRNRIIHRQGGFLASAEEEANEGRMPLAEEDGGQKKVSRFKAARLRKDGGWVR